MEATGETLMCTGCMEMTTIIHDDSIMVDPQTVEHVKNSMKSYAEIVNKPMDEGMMGLLLILIGARFLDWENL